MIMTRREFLKTGSMAAAAAAVAIYFPGASVLAETLQANAFRKSTLKTARNYLVSQKLGREYVEAVLSDSRVEKPELNGVQLSAGELRKKSYKKYKEAFKFGQLKEWGVEFCKDCGMELAASQERTGVPYELTAALLGVESQYGRTIGDRVAVNVFLAKVENAHNAKDPEKARGEALWELAALLKICEKYCKDPLEVKGSYAGAITPAQFMPSNLWKYDREGVVACGTFEDFFSMPSAITLASTYLKRNGRVMSYNPKDTPKYGRLIRELAGEIKKKMDEGAMEAKKEPAEIGPPE